MEENTIKHIREMKQMDEKNRVYKKKSQEYEERMHRYKREADSAIDAERKIRR